MSMQETSRSSASVNRMRGLAWGLPIAIAALVTLYLPQTAWMHSPGPSNIGHEEVGCTDCHQPAEGTLRQQLQAKARYIIGTRATDVAVGHESIENSPCISCHERKSDAHPIDRFSEPRFNKIVPILQVTQCLGCHREHTGRRVTMSSTSCKHCHEGFFMKNDPLDVPHATLVNENNWSTCLGCHDFHGNHIRHAQKRLVDAIPTKPIEDYLAGIGASPYGKDRRFLARKERP